MLDRSFIYAWVGMAHSFAVQDESDQAMSIYRTIVRLFPGCSQAHLYMGMEYLRTNNLKTATLSLMKAKEINPTDPLIYSELGVIWSDSVEPVLEPVTCSSLVIDEHDPQFPGIWWEFPTIGHQSGSWLGAQRGGPCSGDGEGRLCHTRTSPSLASWPRSYAISRSASRRRGHTAVQTLTEAGLVDGEHLLDRVTFEGPRFGAHRWEARGTGFGAAKRPPTLACRAFTADQRRVC